MVKKMQVREFQCTVHNPDIRFTYVYAATVWLDFLFTLLDLSCILKCIVSFT